MCHKRVSAKDDGKEVSLEAAEFRPLSEHDVIHKVKAELEEDITEGFPRNKKRQLQQ